MSDVCLSVTYIGPNSRTERPRKTKIGTESGQKVKGQLVAEVLNSQRVVTGATWRINTKILSTCRGRRHIVSSRAQLVTTFANVMCDFLQCCCNSFIVVKS